MPESLGSTTYTVFLYGVESHKLHMEFEVNTAVAVHKGQPVKLAGSEEKITPLLASDKPHISCIGYSIHDGEAGDLVTVAMRSFVVIIGEAEDALNPGPVEFVGYDTENADNNIEGYNRFSDTDIDEDDSHIGWSLDAATAEGDKIRVALIP